MKKTISCNPNRNMASKVKTVKQRLKRSQPNQSVGFKMELEKRLEITYGQAQRQPIGAWWKSSVAKTRKWRDETFMPKSLLTFCNDADK